MIGVNKFNVNDIGNNENCRRDAMHGVSTFGSPEASGEPVQLSPLVTLNKNESGPQRENLSSIIRGFKSSITKHARQINAGFSWQTRFYDHVIRNDVT